MKIAIVGSRDYARLNRVREYVAALPEGTTVVSGGAKGVDQTAENCARARGLRVESVPVDKVGLPPFGSDESRVEYARRAYARNQKIVDFADFVVAFWNGYSGGTKNTIDRAREQDKLLEIL
jgi:transposase